MHFNSIAVVAGMIVGAIPLDNRNGLVCLVSSKNHPGMLLFPKGKLKSSDPTAFAGAARETFEEAGVLLDKRALRDWRIEAEEEDNNDNEEEKEGEKSYSTDDVKQTRNGLSKETSWWFLAHVEDIKDKWPEMNERERVWMSPQEVVNSKVVKKKYKEICKMLLM